MGDNAEVLVRFVAKHPGWKDSNFQVLKAMCSFVATIAREEPTFNKPSASVCVIGTLSVALS